jgi:hypothetical protein
MIRQMPPKVRIMLFGVMAIIVVISIGPRANSSGTRPTLIQLKDYISASVAIKTTPNLNTTLPPLLSMTSTDASISPARASCYPGSGSTSLAVPADAITRCAYGDVSSPRVLLLTGDSQAGMWLPAFDVMGQDLGWRVIFLAHPECPPWGVPNAPSWIIQGQFTVADCNTYNANVRAWVKKAAPADVILAGRAHPVGSIATKPLVLSVVQPRVSAAITSFQSAKTQVITMLPLPQYTPDWTKYTPSTCLAYIKPITNCEGSPTQMESAVLSQAISNASTADSSETFSTTPLVCTSKRCALFVKDPFGVHLVYYDALHLNRFYSSWIGDALATLIAPLL